MDQQASVNGRRHIGRAQSCAQMQHGLQGKCCPVQATINANVSTVAEPSPVHKMQHALQEHCCPVQATNNAMGNLSLAISTVAEPIPVDVLIVQLNGVQQQAQQLGYSRRGLRQDNSLQLTINVVFPPVSCQVQHDKHPVLCTWLSQGVRAAQQSHHWVVLPHEQKQRGL